MLLRELQENQIAVVINDDSWTGRCIYMRHDMFWFVGNTQDINLYTKICGDMEVRLFAVLAKSGD